jgi:hypothetical protein
VLLFVGGCGVVLLLLVLVRGLDDLLGTSLMLLGVSYVVGLLVGRHVLDEAAPLVAAALLLCAELATWSLEERKRVHAERRFWVARARAVAFLVLGGLAAAALVVAVAATPYGGGLAWTVLGAAAAAAVVVMIARLTVLQR